MVIIAPGKRGTSAAWGNRTQNDLLFFPFWFGAPETRQTRREKGGWVGWLFTQGGASAALLIPYPKLFIAERSGAAWRAGHSEELVVVGRTIGFRQGRVSPWYLLPRAQSDLPKPNR
jgi:hypothetical protein